MFTVATSLDTADRRYSWVQYSREVFTNHDGSLVFFGLDRPSPSFTTV